MPPERPTTEAGAIGAYRMDSGPFVGVAYRDGGVWVRLPGATAADTQAGVRGTCAEVEGVTYTLPLRLVSAPNVREHWATRARRVKAERGAVAWVLGNHPRPSLPVVVTLTRIAPRSLDDDNLRGAFKAPRDQVAKWLSVDDADPRVTWAYGQRRGRAKEYGVEIAFEISP